MVDSYNKNILKIVIAQTCQTIGWNSIQVTPMDIMIDILDKYLKELTKLCHNNAELCNRTQPNLNDLALAFRAMDVNITDIDEYINYVQPITCPIPVPMVPIKKESNLNFLKPGRKEVLTRPVYVYEYLPPILPDNGVTEKENNNEENPTNELDKIEFKDNSNLINDDDEEKPFKEKIIINDDIDVVDTENLEKTEIENENENNANENKNENIPIDEDNINKSEVLNENLIENKNLLKTSLTITDNSSNEISDRKLSETATTTTIDNSIRDISSVLMTSSGFISPCRAGKLPDSKPPQLKERSVTPVLQIIHEPKIISKNLPHFQKSNLKHKVNDSNSQFELSMNQPNSSESKILKFDNVKDEKLKIKKKKLLQTNPPNEIRKSVKQRKRNKLFANSVLARKLLKKQMKMQKNSLKLMDKDNYQTDYQLESSKIDTLKGNMARLKNLGKQTNLQTKKKEKKTKKLQQKNLKPEKQDLNKFHDLFSNQQDLLQYSDDGQFGQKQNRMLLIQDQPEMIKVPSNKKKAMDLPQTKLDKNENYFNKLEVFKPRSTKKDYNIENDSESQKQFISKNSHLIQLPTGTTITPTRNLSNKNIVDAQYNSYQESQIICLNTDENNQAQEIDQKLLSGKNFTSYRNGNSAIGSEQNHPSVSTSQSTGKNSHEKSHKKLKRKAKQLMNLMEDQPLNLTCLEGNSTNVKNFDTMLKNFQLRNPEMIQKNMDNDKIQNLFTQSDMQKFSDGITPKELEKLHKKERKNKKMKTSNNSEQISKKQSQIDSNQQQQLLYPATITSNSDLKMTNLDNMSAMNKKSQKTETISKPKKKSGSKSAQSKMSQIDEVPHQSQQEQNAAVVLKAAAKNPFLTAAAGGLFSQFSYSGFPTGPGLIPPTLFSPGGSFIPSIKQGGLTSIPDGQLANNPVFNKFHFPTLNITSTVTEKMEEDPEVLLRGMETEKYCNIAPLISDSIIKSIKSSSRQSDAEYRNEVNYLIGINEKSKHGLLSKDDDDEQEQTIEISDDDNKKSDEEHKTDKNLNKTLLSNAQSSDNWTNVRGIESQEQNNFQIDHYLNMNSEDGLQTPISDEIFPPFPREQVLFENQFESDDAANQPNEEPVNAPKVKHRKEHHHHKKDKHKGKIQFPSSSVYSELHQKSRKSKKEKKTKSKEKLEKKLREKIEKGNIALNFGNESENNNDLDLCKLKLDRLQKKLQKKEKRKEKQKEKLQKQEQKNEQKHENKTGSQIVGSSTDTKYISLERDNSPELVRILPLVTRPHRLQPVPTKLKEKLSDDLISNQPGTSSQMLMPGPSIVCGGQQQHTGLLSPESSSSSCSGGTGRGPGRPRGSGNKSSQVRSGGSATSKSHSVVSSTTVTEPTKSSGKKILEQPTADVNEVWICPACGRVDDGTPMIGCDGCDAWYHWVCVGIQVPPDENENWYCRVCIAKKQESHENDKKKKKKKTKKIKHTV